MAGGNNEFIELVEIFRRYRKALIDTYGIVPFSKEVIVSVEGDVLDIMEVPFCDNGRYYRDISIAPDKDTELRSIRFSGDDILSEYFKIQKGDKIRACVVKGLLDGEKVTKRLGIFQDIFKLGNIICIDKKELSRLERAIGVVVLNGEKKKRYFDDYFVDVRFS